MNRHAYGANVGWLDWRADDASGAVVGDYICQRYLFAANLGWVSLGSGVPANAARYQNNSATNFGVNHDGLGNLRGYAYSANVGWINFDDLGAPKVDLLTGRLSGLGLLLPAGATTSQVLTAETNSFQDYFRVKAVRPLSQ